MAILGRAQSGKKTLSEQISKKLGSNIKVFCLDKILVEAVNYVAPKPEKEEVVVDPKAKGKGKAPPVETESKDIFEGKDVVQYKKLAEQIRTTYLTQEFPADKQGVDLIEQIPDD